MSILRTIRLSALGCLLVATPLGEGCASPADRRAEEVAAETLARAWANERHIYPIVAIVCRLELGVGYCDISTGVSVIPVVCGDFLGEGECCHLRMGRKT